MASFAKTGVAVGELVLVNQGLTKSTKSTGKKGSGKPSRGVVRFFGDTSFAVGKWVGVELSKPRGKNDGSVHGIKYFKCEQGHGLFVRPGSLMRPEDYVEEEAGPNGDGDGDDDVMMDVDHEGKELDEADEEEPWFGAEARSFIFDKSTKQWIELGSGAVHLHWSPAHGKVGLRLADPTSADRKCLDHLVDAHTKLEPTVVSQQSWVFRAYRQMDPTTKDVLCLQFATVAASALFVKGFEEKRATLGEEVQDKIRKHGGGKGAKKGDGDDDGYGDKTKLMRRRLTVAGSDPNLDGFGREHGSGLSPRASSPTTLRCGEVGQWPAEADGSAGSASSAGAKASSSSSSRGRNAGICVPAYSGVSRKGLAPYNPDKQNQDSIVMQQLPSNGYAKGELLLCVFDGHGENGHHVSRHCAARLAKLLASSPKFAQGDFTGPVLADSLLTIENELIQDRSIDTTLSGTTAVATVLRGSTLFVANVGDSRIVKGVHKAGKNGAPAKMVAVDLSEDHKPDLEKEQQRITSLGGRVFAMKYDDGIDGPARVWLSYADMPGLAMSRSLCDTVGKEAGVISNAELHEHELVKGRDRFYVVATDGLWEFMSSQEVVDIISKYEATRNTRGAIAELVRESNKRWQQEEPVIDDTSIVVAFLE